MTSWKPTGAFETNQYGRRLRNWSLAAFLALSTSAHAAQFTWHPSADTSQSIGSVTVDGHIQADDSKKLLRALGDREGARGVPLDIWLNSKGGDFDEGLRISKIVYERFLTTRLAPKAICLSACSIIFMADRIYTTSTYEKNRWMHPTAILGFHAPEVTVPSGNFDAADLKNAYAKAVDQIGRQLIEISRFRDHSWTNPVIKPALIDEMLTRHGNNFFFIDTIGKAAEFEIQLDGVAPPPVLGQAERKNACQNAIAAFADSSVASQAMKWWLAGVGEKISTLDEDVKAFEYQGNPYRGQLCVVRQAMARRSLGYDDILRGVSVSTSGEKIPVLVADWFLWPAGTALKSIPLH